jgi:hypothetical protein
VEAAATLSRLAAGPIRSAAESLMHSALKPSVAIREADSVKAIQTMLDEGINVSKAGVEKLKARISDLNQQITKAISNSPATVDKNKAASEIFKTIEKFEKQVTPGADVKAIEQAWLEFMSHPLIKGDQIPVQLAQELKQGTYGILKGKYGEVGSASTEAQKAIARGLKEEIATAVPEVSALNARESALLNALQQAERRARVAGNNNITGIGLLANNPTAFAAFMADKSSAFKSAIARMINSVDPVAATRLGIGSGVAANQ